jgi:hypothetical protein
LLLRAHRDWIGGSLESSNQSVYGAHYTLLGLGRYAIGPTKPSPAFHL